MLSETVHHKLFSLKTVTFTLYTRKIRRNKHSTLYFHKMYSMIDFLMDFRNCIYSSLPRKPHFQVFYNPSNNPDNPFGSSRAVYDYISCWKAPEGNKNDSYLTFFSSGRRPNSKPVPVSHFALANKSRCCVHRSSLKFVK